MLWRGLGLFGAVCATGCTLVSGLDRLSFDSFAPACGGLNSGGIAAVAVGEHHSCAVRQGGALLCWGDDRSGQLGDGDLDASPAVQVQLPGVAKLALGGNHSCALTGDGRVFCWGDNSRGGVGDGTNLPRPLPTPVSLPGPASALALGGQQSCALVKDGGVYCWGSNGSGELGDGTNTDHDAPEKVGTPAGVDHIAAYGPTSCAVNGAAVRCWGAGYQSSPQLDLTLQAPVQELGIGGGFRCALLTDKTVWCWGDNSYGQLGTGDQKPVTGQVQPKLPAGKVVQHIAVGDGTTCALTADGAVYCWGYNDYVRAGIPGPEYVPTPSQVMLPSPVASIASGASHSCAIDNDGALSCWGFDGHGQLGDGALRDRAAPAQPLSPVDSGIALFAGGDGHSCALKKDGSLWCWGRKSDGQLGSGATMSKPVPQIVALPGPAAVVGAGDGHTCAGLADGRTFCWGDNVFGDLGNGVGEYPATPVPYPVAPLGPSFASVPVAQLALADSFSLARRADGSLWAWGSGDLGRLGDGLQANIADPEPLRSLGTVSAVAAGAGGGCAVKPDGTLWCWGDDANGQLGVSPMPPNCSSNNPCAPSPVQVAGLSSVVSVARGATHTCAAKGDGSLWCWGSDGSGELGDGSKMDQPAPVQVPTLSGVAQIAAGNGTTCAVTSGGQLYCWGANDHGQLGNGTTGSSSTPFPIQALQGVVSVAAASNASSGANTCAITADGSLYCWGANYYGQLGDGAFDDQHAPAKVLEPCAP